MSESYVPKLGQLCDDSDRRDAVHIALAPVIAACNLEPGQFVGLVNGQATWNVETFIGVVDPFLKDEVKKGERFWLMLLPGTITGLRHVWSHPAFKARVMEINDEYPRSL